MFLLLQEAIHPVIDCVQMFQVGGLPGMQCANAVQIMVSLAQHTKQCGQQIHYLKLDFSGAFDKVSHFTLVRTLQALGIEPLLTHAFCQTYKQSSISVGTL